VLLLYQQQAEARPMVEFTQRLRETLQKELAWPVEFYQEALDLDRFTGYERSSPLILYFDNKYRGFGIDVVVPIGSRALQFAIEQLNGILPNVPVVFALNAATETKPAQLPANVTGRLVPASRFAPTLAMARRLQPDAERVFVIGGASGPDSSAVAAAKTALGAAHDTLAVTVLQGLSLVTLLGELHKLPARSIVMLANFRRDRLGQVFDPVDIVGVMARASAAPMYAQLRSYVGEGVVGGSVTNFDDEGARTGRLVARVLRRRDGERMPPVEIIANAFVADWRQLRRWGLSENRLPPSTEVLFREPGLWKRYRTEVLFTLGIVVVQSLLIGLLLLERRRRKQAQLAVQEQAAYEQTMAALTADAARHAPDDAPRALEDALARIGRYAGASAATLVEFSDASVEPPPRLFWSAPTNGGSHSRPPAPVPASDSRSDAPLEIPLVADGTAIGTLELHRTDGLGWSAHLARRLDSAGEIIASAMARSRAARTIRRGEELNRAVLASVSTQIAILDQRGTIIRVNEAWRQFARRTEVDVDFEAIVGSNYLDEYRRAEDRGCEDARDIRLGIEAVLERRAWPFRHEYHWSAPDERWYELVVDRLESSEGGAIVTHVDITDRRLAEQRSEETRRQVAHMGRVALVGELAATISHELRQPLAAIRVNAEAGNLLLTSAPTDVWEAREIFRSIVADDARAVEVIEGVRKLLRKDEQVATTVDLNQVCRDAVRLLRHDAALRNTRLELSLDPEPPMVAGDPIQLQQVVLNLALNGLEAASTSRNDRSVVVGTQSRVDHTEVLVRDSGPGIPPNVQSHLFESFFSTKTGGLGLGLVIVRSIVERHNGRVRVENHSLGGAVFRVRLPIARG
jgi:signal transduction histidine kinase/ABC-type uncharacterized transport system substrate-binding protein